MVFMKAELLQVKIPVFISRHFGGGSFFSISVFRGCKQDSSGEGELLLCSLSSRNSELTANTHI